MWKLELEEGKICLCKGRDTVPVKLPSADVIRKVQARGGQSLYTAYQVADDVMAAKDGKHGSYEGAR